MHAHNCLGSLLGNARSYDCFARTLFVPCSALFYTCHTCVALLLCWSNRIFVILCFVDTNMLYDILKGCIAVGTYAFHMFFVGNKSLVLPVELIPNRDGMFQVIVHS